MGAIFSRNLGDDHDDGDNVYKGLSEKDLQQLGEQLKKVNAEPVFRKLGYAQKVTKIITADHIECDFLKEIFKGNSELALHLLNQSRLSNEWELGYEHDILLAYLLAIQKEDIRVASALVDFDQSLRYITTLAIKGETECPISEEKMNFKVLDERRAEQEALKTPAVKTVNDASDAPSLLSPGLEVDAQNSALLSVDDKSGASQLEGGSKNKTAISKPKVNDIGLTVEDLYEGGQGKEGDTESDNESHCSNSFDTDNNSSQNDQSSQDAFDNLGEVDKKEEKEETSSSSDSAEDVKSDNIVKNEKGKAAEPPKKLPPAFKLYNHNMLDYLQVKYISGKMVELTEIKTKWQIKKIKVGFQLNFPNIMAYIIRILLHREELDLACYFTAFYNFNLDERMLLEAIVNDQYRWINYVWAFRKHYYPYTPGKKADNEETEENEMIIKVNDKQVLVIDLKELFRLVMQVYEGKGNQIQQQEVEKCCLWYLDFWDYDDQNDSEEDEDKESGSMIVQAINKIKSKFSKNKDTDQSEDGSNQEEKKDNENKQGQETKEDKKQNQKIQWPVENILKALLFHLFDNLALKYMGYYADKLSEDLFLFSLETNNKQFIQQSLIMGAFDKQIFQEEEVVTQMIGLLEIGSKTNFLLNTMLLVDVSLWRNEQLIELINALSAYASDTYDENRLLLSYNPMQAIALSAEILDAIAKSRKRFENQCMNLKDDLLDLGKYYNSKIDDEITFSSLVFDCDFENRSVLKIITASEFAPLMHEEDPKAENIMNQIYVGKESTQCDGNVYGYSTFMHILTQKPKKIPEGTKVDFLEMITIDFAYKIDVDYTFQHRYRSKSINMYFLKEMLFGLITTGISIFIYFTYLQDFKGKLAYVVTTKHENGTITSKFNDTLASNSDLYDYASFKDKLDQNHNYLSDEIYHQTILENYNNFIGTFVYIQYGLTAILLLTLALRIYFNIFKKSEVNAIAIDSYLQVDIVFAVYSIMVFWYIQIQDASVLYGPKKKLIDWAVAIVFILALGRYFLLQLVVSEVSKMLLTLIYMVIDVIPFAVIMLAYMYLATQIFSTRYQDIEQNQYGNLPQSLMTTFDAMMGGYVYSGVKEDEWIYTLIVIFHIFVINILMLNFMIAILSTTYGDMLESGQFLYKCALYNYCERYMIAFNEDRLGELVVHSPPMNMFALVMLPFTIIPDEVDPETGVVKYSFMAKVANYFSIFIFWLENLIVIPFFMMFEIALMVFVYLITFFNIIYSTPGLFTTAFYIIKWMIFGIFYLIYLLFYDTYMLMWIFSCHRGCLEYQESIALEVPSTGQKEDKEEDEEPPLEENDERRIGVYNDLRNVVIDMYLKEHKDIVGGIDDKAEEMTKSEKAKFLDGIRADILTRLNNDQDQMKIDGIEYDITQFNVKLVAIEDEWKKSKAPSADDQNVQQKDAKEDDKDKENEEQGNDMSMDESGKPTNKSKDIEKNKNPEPMTNKERLQQQLIGAQRMGETKDHQNATEIKDALILFEGEEGKEDEDEDEDDIKPPEYPVDEYKLVGEILKKFLIGSDSAFLDTVNLVLMLRALPNKIVKFNLDTSMLFNFSNLQNSLIAFLTKEQVDAFEHFDVLNKGRIQNIRDCIISQNNDLDQVNTIMETIEEYVDNYDKIIHEFDSLWKGWDQSRKDAQERIIESKQPSKEVQVKGKSKKKKAPKKK